MPLARITDTATRTPSEPRASARRRVHGLAIVKTAPPTEGARSTWSSERDLVERLRRGDDAAYETLVRAHGPSMLAVASRYLPTREDAEDATQAAFLLAFRFIHRFEGASKLSTWLHRIVVNSALMRLRRQRRDPGARLSISDLEPDGVAEVADPVGVSVADVLARREAHERLLHAVGRLPDPVRATVRLRVVDGLTIAQTSQLLGHSVAAVKRSVQRGRTSLRAMLTGGGDSSVRRPDWS